MNETEMIPVAATQTVARKMPTQRRKGNQTIRHLGSLMKKNALNYRRTWKSSLCEIACPAALVGLLVWLRTLDGLVNEIAATDPLEGQVSLYAPALANSNGDLEVNPFSISTRMYDFLSYAEYPRGVNKTTNQYSIKKDFAGPMAFNPVNCQNKEGKKKIAAENEQAAEQDKDEERSSYSSPLIGIVGKTNTIQEQLQGQLQAIFTLRRDTFFKFQTFDSKDQMFDYISSSQYGLETHPAVCFGFQVHENSQTDYEVELFFNALNPREFTSLPDQKQDGADQTQQAPRDDAYFKYVNGGFALMENLAANAILKEATENQNAEIANTIMPFKADAIKNDNFPRVLMPTLSFFIQLMYIPFLYNTIRRIVSEKSTRARESMRMMGMSETAYWLSWIIYWTAINTTIATLCTLLFIVNIFQAEHGFAVWLFIWLFGQSLFGLLIIAQALFASPKNAASSTSGLYFCTSLIQQILITENTAYGSKVAACWFLPTLSMINGAQPLANNFAVGRVANWTLQYQFFSVADACWLMVVGGINLLLIGIYLEFALPKEYGKRRHPLFFLMCCCDKSQKKNSNEVMRGGRGDNHETKYLDPSCHEGVAPEIALKEDENKILKISDLMKVYNNGFKAVDGVNLKMYEDQIFVLLGHNGAGKTTTISMLTGLFEQSGGSAELFGIDMFNDMTQVRQIMGVCPQHDVLFELLTVEEHLSFFYDMKGADPKLKKAEIEKLLKDLGLIDQRNKQAMTLSGGNKRKLSVGIALCGQSKFVLLDEPTSGLDLSARRQLWNMLKEYKKERIIILTTHYMDEADILGDRIGIMKSGKITALGSSIFLKSTFGAGYNMIIVKKSSEPNQNVLPYLHEALGTECIKQSEIQSEMTIQIPQKYSQYFVKFFSQFDSDLDRLGIQSYGITISTLEEVFLKVGNLDDKAAPGIVEQVKKELSAPDLERQKTIQFNFKDNANQIDQSFFNNLLAVLYARWSNYKRNKYLIFNDAILPALLLILGVGLSQIQIDFTQPSRILMPDRLPLPQTVFMNPSPAVQSSDITSQNLFGGLPDASDAFRPNYDTDWNPSTTTTLNFIDEIWENRRDELPYMYGAYQIYEADSQSHKYSFISHVNKTSQDAPGLYQQFMYESIIKQATGNTNFKFKIRSTPYPPTTRLQLRINGEELNAILIQMSIAISIILMGIARYLVAERNSGLKHLQVISGMQLKSYWVGCFIFDCLKMYTTIITALILFAAFDLELNDTMATLVLLPFGAIPFTYALSFVFTSESAASSAQLFLHITILGILSAITFTFRVAIPFLMDDGDQMHAWFKLIPTYNVGAAMYCDRQCQVLSDVRKSPFAEGDELPAEKWAFQNMTLDTLMMVFHFIFWTLLIVLVEKGVFNVLRMKTDNTVSQEALELDDDVKREVERVVNKSETPDTVQVEHMKKVFKIPTKKCCGSEKINAVNDLSFGLQQGECFALLGVNGAGKSTTFKSLTGEVVPTKGKITIAGFDIKKDFEKARQMIGYCPQENLIFDEMTCEEHLTYYAQVKGIPKNLRTSIVEEAITQLGLDAHRKKEAKNLSGGNKRKLCVAIALLGNPSIILLDEPSAGMDPESRRFMWSVVGRIAQKKSSAVVLTTHSMEEAEALSTKMGILVKGGIFKCFGSSQHIKNKFGTGYVIEFKTRTLDDEELPMMKERYMPQGNAVAQSCFDDKVNYIIHENSVEFERENDRIRQSHSDVNLFKCVLEMCKVFEKVEVIEKYGNYMRVRVERLNKSIGSVFGLVEQMKGEHDISEYSVSQTTLEQIFQGFADLKFAVNVQTYGLKGPNQLTQLSDQQKIE